MLIDPQQLRSFVAVADLASVSRAAEAVHLTQSAVSAQIKRLEAQLGVQVLERTTRSVRLTSHGATLLGYARSILSLNEQATVRLGSTRGLHGAIRIGCSEGFAAEWLFEAVMAFGAKYPHMEVTVTSGISTELSELLRRRELDIAVGAHCAAAPIGELLWREPLVWAYSERCFMDPLKPIPVAFLREPCPFREAATRALVGHQLSWKIALTAQSGSGVLAAASCGLAATPVTPSLMGRGLRAIEQSDVLPALPPVDFVMELRAGGLSEPILELSADVRRACHRWMSAVRP